MPETDSLTIAARKALGAADGPARSSRRRFGFHRLALGSLVEPSNLVAHANQKHGLLGVLQNVDDPFLLVFQINGLSVGDQVQIRLGLQNVRQPLAHFALEEPQDAPDFLERKAFAPQFGDDSNFDYFLGLIDALVTFVAGGDHLAFVPPLQLPQTDLGDARNVA